MTRALGVCSVLYVAVATVGTQSSESVDSTISTSILLPVAVSTVRLSELVNRDVDGADAQLANGFPSPDPAAVFEGLDDTPSPGSTTLVAPPDVSGAVGWGRVISAQNNYYRVLSRAQDVVTTVSINDFWESTGATEPFGTRVALDRKRGRFTITAASDRRSARSSLLVGVSTTVDPAGEWTLWRFELGGTACGGGNACWADAPAMGFGDYYAAISVNMRDNSTDAFQESRVNILSLDGLRRGSTPTDSVVVASDFAIQPVMGDVSSDNVLYAVAHVSAADASFRIFSFSVQSGPQIYTQSALKAHTLVGPWSEPGSIGLPQGPNPYGSTATIDPGDSRITSAIADGSSITYTQTIGLPAGGTYTHTAVQKVTVATDGRDWSVVRIEDSTATATNGGKWYAYPSIGCGRRIVFSQFSSSTYPTAAFVVSSLDPAPVKPGQGYYERATDASRNPWGVGQLVHDPVSSDLSNFCWSLEPYAKVQDVPTAANPTGSRWGTTWARFDDNVYTVMQMAVDGVTPPTAVENEPFVASGWAIDLAAPIALGTGIDYVDVDVWQLSRKIYTYRATLGAARPDIQASVGSPQFANSGFSVTFPGLPIGDYAIQATAHSAVTGRTRGASRDLKVRPRLGMIVDSPKPGSILRQDFTVNGWAVDRFATSGTGIDRVDVYAAPIVNGVVGSATLLGQATLGQHRWDIVSIYGEQFRYCGFTMSVSGMHGGTYQLNVQAHSSVSGTVSQSAVIDITVSPDAAMGIDQAPTLGSRTQPFTISGWAIDRGAATGTGVDTLHVWAFPIVNDGFGAPVFVGAAAYGGARSDIASMYGSRYTYSGYSQTVSGLPPGSYVLGVYAHSTATGTFNQYQLIDVAALVQPMLHLDAPADGAVVGTSFAIGGWAIDRSAGAGSSGVDTVHIWAFPKDGSAPFLVGASYGRPRPDIAAIYGPQFNDSGFRIDVTDFPPGAYRIVAYAHDVITGSFSAQQGADVTVLAESE